MVATDLCRVSFGMMAVIACFWCGQCVADQRIPSTQAAPAVGLTAYVSSQKLQLGQPLVLVIEIQNNLSMDFPVFQDVAARTIFAAAPATTGVGLVVPDKEHQETRLFAAIYYPQAKRRMPSAVDHRMNADPVVCRSKQSTLLKFELPSRHFQAGFCRLLLTLRGEAGEIAQSQVVEIEVVAAGKPAGKDD